MNYDEVLDFMVQQLPMFQRTGPAALKPNLDNIIHLAGKLKNPHNKYPTIHIGGTNGKGTLTHLLAAALQSHGMNVGIYVSPHYKNLRERIRVNGEWINEKYITNFINTNIGLIDEIKPSFFEIMVAMALKYFEDKHVDIAIIEVGLGGLLDSTNIIDPVMSVITNIGYDHTDILGKTLREIAVQKAGIIKNQKPVVIGETHEETRQVFQETADARQAPIYFADQRYRAEITEESVEHTTYNIYKGENLFMQDLKVNFHGDYQVKNLGTFFMALEVLEKKGVYQLDEINLRLALRNLRSMTGFWGRWTIVSQDPVIVMDSAHNEDGIRIAARQLEKLSYTKLHIVFGVVKDKDISTILGILPKHATYYFCKADIPRGLEAEALLQQAEEKGLKGQTYGSVTLAYEAALANAAKEDVIYVGGSIFVTGELAPAGQRV